MVAAVSQSYLPSWQNFGKTVANFLFRLVENMCLLCQIGM